MDPRYTEADGIESLGHDDHRTWLVVNAIDSAAAARVGDVVAFGGRPYRVVSVGRKYKVGPRSWALRLYVAGVDEPPATGGATEAQVVALLGFGVRAALAEGATRAQASDWLDELVASKGMQGGAGEIRRVVDRINRVGE